jgi:hypothetical protein
MDDARKIFSDYVAENGNDPVKLVTTKPDTEVAAELKKEAEAKLLELCAIMNRASRAGFVIGFNVGQIPSGWVLQTLTIARHF